MAGSARRCWCPSMANCATWPSRRASATANGIKRTIVQKNGDVIRLAPDGPEKIGEVQAGRLVLDGDVILPADGMTMNERRKLMLHGHISVGLALSAKAADDGQCRDPHEGRADRGGSRGVSGGGRRRRWSPPCATASRKGDIEAMREGRADRCAPCCNAIGPARSRSST